MSGLNLVLLLSVTQKLHIEGLFLQLLLELLFMLFGFGELEQGPVETLFDVLQLFLTFTQFFARPTRQQLGLVALQPQSFLLRQRRV